MAERVCPLFHPATPTERSRPAPERSSLLIPQMSQSCSRARAFLRRCALLLVLPLGCSLGTTAFEPLATEQIASPSQPEPSRTNTADSGAPEVRSRDCDAGSDCEVADPPSLGSCFDGLLNFGEQGVDCGGRCSRACAAPSVGGPSCGAAGQCTTDPCDNDEQDGDETGIDCGGSCSACALGAACRSGADCATGVCADGECKEPSCSDGARNQGELGVDCGGPCAACVTAQSCSANTDCNSGVCAAANCGAAERCCQPPSCNDGVQNGEESGIDCGAACGGCALGAVCTVTAECASARCDDGRCRSCADGVQSGRETGIDCGGPCPACAAGVVCTSDAQCARGACQDGRCCGGSGGDCTRCALRLSGNVDCSGSRDSFGVGTCNSYLQCLRDNADLCAQSSAAVCSGDPGGVCNHNDFGGNLGTGVSRANEVLSAAGCAL
jgi:hypothetical protein